MTTKDSILDFIKANKSFLQEQYSVEKIALFGSFARNEQTIDSDIDLLVTLKENTTDIYEVMQRIRDFFTRQFHCNIDIASEKYLKSYIREEILHEAQYA